MEKKLLLGAVIVVVCLCGPGALAQEKTGELHGVIDVTYQSKNIWRGIDVYGDKSAIQPSVDLDLFGTGFGVNVMGHRANASGFEEVVPADMHSGERWDYTLYYQNMLCADQSYATMYRVGWVYYNFPDNRSRDFDLQELQMVLAWPKILEVKGLVPTYVLVKLWPSRSDSCVDGAASGFAHIFMLDYGLETTCPITNQPRVWKLHSEVVYNDGVDPRGIGVDHDWSNAVFGISTDVDLGSNFTFTPGVYHQVTMDDSINDDKDETWAAMSVNYKF